MGHAGQRGAGHPHRQDHGQVGRHRPDPRGRRHRRLAQPAAGRRRGPAGLAGADRGGQGARRRRARGQPGRPGLRRERTARSRWPATRTPRCRWPAWPRPSGCSCGSVFSAPGATFPFGAHVAVVEVDTETGKVSLRRMITVDDAGTVLNPLLAEGQRHGGIAQGAAQAFLEEVVYDARRQPADRELRRLPVPVRDRGAQLRAGRHGHAHQLQPARGQGHRGGRARSASTPAVQNAVVDAVAHLGVRHIDMPTSPQRVWRALQAATAGRRVMQVKLTVNGEQRSDDVEPRLLLVHYLRERAAACGRPTSAATPPRAAPARCC